MKRKIQNLKVLNSKVARLYKLLMLILKYMPINPQFMIMYHL